MSSQVRQVTTSRCPSMARPPIKALVEAKVEAYIALAVERPPFEMSLATAAVARAIGHDRRVLAKYRLDERLRIAAERQRRRHGASATRRRAEGLDRIAVLTAERDRYQAENQRLLGLLALIEGNAKQLDIDPEQLYEPLDTPDRTVSNVFRTRTRAR